MKLPPCPPDLEDADPSSYAPLPDFSTSKKNKWNSSAGVLFSAVCVFALLLVVLNRSGGGESPVAVRPLSRGMSEGVSEKSVHSNLGDYKPFGWTDGMLLWQRTGFHFQPTKNWMNDPNGPIFYKGWYHLFYQYNPRGPIWGKISWGHAASRDLLHWTHLPLALLPDSWYDINGVWTGSATLLPDGTIYMLYTGSTNESVQVQNLAFPADPTDPLLTHWLKHDSNPLLLPPPGIHVRDFRDPTTAWLASDGSWRFAIGSKVNRTGLAIMYKTMDFLHYEVMEEVLHAVEGTGMWECIDFYPVSTAGVKGLDTSTKGPGVKHVMKTSLDDDNKDYYAIGSYIEEEGRWTPDDPEVDVGIGIRYDYGKYYASKSFYDQEKERRVLWGWIGETDSEETDFKKGWASLQGIPRVVWYDNKTKSNLIQWPVVEVESLRFNRKELSNITMAPGSVVPLEVGKGTQLDISAEFEVWGENLEDSVGGEMYNCSTSKGATGRREMGPFGILVLADDSLSEQTAIYFYVEKGADLRSAQTFICQDELRSSKANDVIKSVYGSVVPVLDGERFSVRILVDHSIVETFAQGGRRCITSRVYPTEVIHGGARAFLFNNSTKLHVTATSVTTWEMKSAEASNSFIILPHCTLSFFNTLLLSSLLFAFI